jgi:hypothetical protein
MSHEQHTRTRREERTLYVRVPRVHAVTAALSVSSTGTALVTGVVPADSPLVWPLITLALASMAYDICIRALRRAGK